MQSWIKVRVVLGFVLCETESGTPFSFAFNIADLWLHIECWADFRIAGEKIVGEEGSI